VQGVRLSRTSTPLDDRPLPAAAASASIGVSNNSLLTTAGLRGLDALPAIGEPLKSAGDDASI